jgi:hypothetical protein
MKLLEEMDYSSGDENEEDHEIVKKLDGKIFNLMFRALF